MARVVRALRDRVKMSELERIDALFPGADSGTDAASETASLSGRSIKSGKSVVSGLSTLSRGTSTLGKSTPVETDLEAGISAKVSGTTIRIVPGSRNKGIFVRLAGGPGEGETYDIAHPYPAQELLCEATIIECSAWADGEKLRAVIEYK
ncbi:uncharacterized protein C8Q71DRAFT_861391 [Rhodofomes roseus]|uniref:Uncharacterized protein n=1 Tax=Rhodofomes roseus TaxID=34475 RepID=A0ABQ8K5B0_9APHY|nr:uncharacterized protein C8Q71DRAFT_861387 [Rhodofomes roseus]XP_047775157.1 uncharacterized protein C8Q71DRAFT_861391 [Rhodofomes roseus]KAH9832106.1 hypothetical protein C8Q71DRAFT_861387 [Rhodofomes roseus]KAH9832111.1 hypothetical protein C8Q71DRAFT_861391 [Rhodofomes roseus]